MLVLKYLESARWFHRVSPNFLGLLSHIHDRSTIRPGSSMMGTSSRLVVYCGAKKTWVSCIFTDLETEPLGPTCFFVVLHGYGKPILRWVEPFETIETVFEFISDLLPPLRTVIPRGKKRCHSLSFQQFNNESVAGSFIPHAAVVRRAIGASLFVGTARPSLGDFLCAFHVRPFRIYLKCTP